MKTCTVLPERYEAAASVDLQNDKRKALLVNGLSAAVMLLMILLGHFLIRPVTDLFGFDDTNSGWFLRIAVMMAGLFVYVILHELAHAAAMKSFGAKQVRFGFTGLYAFAGSEADYLDLDGAADRVRDPVYRSDDRRSVRLVLGILFLADRQRLRLRGRSLRLLPDGCFAGHRSDSGYRDVDALLSAGRRSRDRVRRFRRVSLKRGGEKG